MDDKGIKFVRCPGCRSLVPSMARHCRMCGETLVPEQENGVDSTSNEGGFSPASSVNSAERHASQIFSIDEEVSSEKEIENEKPDINSSNSGTIYNLLKHEHIEDDIDSYPITAEDIEEEGSNDRWRAPENNVVSDSNSARPAQINKNNEVKNTGVSFEVKKEAVKPSSSVERLVKRKDRGNIDATTNFRAPNIVSHEDIPNKTNDKDTNEKQNHQTQINTPTTISKQLLGWLVSFKKDESGNAVELREGRFFITSSRVRDTDMVIPDAAISIPHCLLKVNAGSGVQIQDLMSENGTFIKLVGQREFEKVTVPTNINHGDWVRFGEYDVLVCLVPM